jgi:hypothetical protein
MRVDDEVRVTPSFFDRFTREFVIQDRALPEIAD